MANWNHDGNLVFTGASPIVWNSIDLKVKSGGGATTHPNARTIALLKVEATTGYPYIAFRPNASGLNTYVAQPNGHGCCMLSLNSATNDAALALVPTGNTGFIDWITDISSNVNITLVGWIQATVSDQQVFASGAMPSSWADLDLTEDTGAVPTLLTTKALAFLWYTRSGGTGNSIATRPKGGAANFLYNNSIGGCSQGYPFAIGETEGYVMKTDSDGFIQHIANPTVPNASADLASFEQTGFTDFDLEKYAAAAPPTVWQALDMSSEVGSQRALVMLQVHMENASPGAKQLVAFRADDDAGDYLPGTVFDAMGVACSGLNEDKRTMVLVETGPTGGLEWISNSTLRDVDVRLMGYLSSISAPTITSETPTGNNESAEVAVGFNCQDGIAIDINEIDLDLTDPSLVTTSVLINGIWQSGYNGTIDTNASNGYDVRLKKHPVFDVGTWQAFAFVKNTTGQSAMSLWSFTVGSMAIVRGWQSSLNTVDIEFDEEPRYLDPVDPTDSKYLANYTITGPTVPARLLQSVEDLGDNTIRLHFDGELVEGESYTIGVSNILSTSGHPVSPSPSTFSFVAFGPSARPIPLEQQTDVEWDIRNPQSDKDAPTDSPLGTFVYDRDGDLGVESKRSYLRKRIFRRISTKKGTMLHEPDYGLDIEKGKLYRSFDLRKLQIDAQSQIQSEPGVVETSVTVQEISDGVFRITVKVKDKFGVFDVDATLGGE